MEKVLLILQLLHPFIPISTVIREMRVNKRQQKQKQKLLDPNVCFHEYCGGEIPFALGRFGQTGKRSHGNRFAWS